MLTRRVCGGVRNALPVSSVAITASRPFSSFAAAQGPARAPALADITHDGAPKFNERQKEFRESLVNAQKQKEQQEKDARAREAQEGGKKKGALSSLIYGTPEGRELDKDIERSFSQVLARGKYVHSIVFHEVKPDKVDEYVELVGQWYPKMASMPEHKVHLVGSWRAEVGACDTFVHIWEYQRYQGYHASLNAIQHHPDFPEFDRKLKKLIHSKRTSLMQEFSFWPTTPPRHLGGLFELRSYTLHPGNLLEWETHWRRGLKARREVMEGVGAWFVQIGELNTVHHLWQFADLEERKIRREQSWGIEGWGETVHKTVPLIQQMKSSILIPCPWSPVA
ncbi:NIPSNAP-domain-containing protein [Clohesyomyces aquaticus]|uniref:NIPSNAP-domain-containing protein n=1 Tax=Clohesyomyces aquaticus TaxID=1231657 RepID=A0A1Y1YRL2_9PLEO|nr:NIPSNAP-domain-containing protein [Clohesyomyces aquaticus]